MQQQRLSEETSLRDDAIVRTYGKCEMKKRYAKSDKWRRKMSKITKRLWKDPEFRAVHIAKRWTPKNKREHGKKVKKLWKKVYSKVLYTPKARKRRLKKWKETFRRKDVRQNHRLATAAAMKEVLRRKKTKSNPERQVERLLSELGLKYLYVGNWQFSVNGFCPDFKHKRFRWLIEVYGSYYHKGRKGDVKRIANFLRYGYKILVIWDFELKDAKKLIRKIHKFHRTRNRKIKAEMTLARKIVAR